MAEHLDTVSISGFKSIRSLENFELRNLNILLGANGSGKSNLLSFFEMMNALMNDRLDYYILKAGGVEGFLHNGRKVTEQMTFEMMFGARGYRFTVVPDGHRGFFLTDEALYGAQDNNGWQAVRSLSHGQPALVNIVKEQLPIYEQCKPIYDTVLSWRSYHFHDTTATAGMRHAQDVDDYRFLRGDGSNVAPFLYRLLNKNPENYKEIVQICRLVMPYFEDFVLDPEEYGPKPMVNLSWKARNTDYPMQPYHFSDGSIRFICLATALLQPNLPSMMLIDEPELGIHHDALSFLSELITAASRHTQLIIATQSPSLINYFSIEDIVIAGHRGGASEFKRLVESDYNIHLEENSIGDLWERNVICGGPVYG